MAEPQQGFVGRMGKEIREMPGEVSRFAQKIPGLIGQLPGRLSSGAKGVASGYKRITGNYPSGLSKEEELYGMNPRQAYWSASLSDMASVIAQQGNPGKRFEIMEAQQRHTQNLRQAQELKKYREQMAKAALLNATKPRGSDWTGHMKDATAILGADKVYSPEWQELVRKLSMTPAMQFNMGPKVGTEFYQDVLSNIPDARADARKAQTDITRYKVMESLIPHMGATGLGKDMMTSFRSALNQFGMNEYAEFMDAVGEAAGIDFFSGDQGVTELFRALGTEDIIGQAKQLYPVSNSDINLLREMVASLRINDKDTLRVLIQSGLNKAQIPIDRFNELRGYITNSPQEIRDALPPIPGLPALPFLDIKGVVPDDEYERERALMLGPRDNPWTDAQRQEAWRQQAADKAAGSQ